MQPIIVLTADDFALTEGVSRAIEDLAQLDLLSATGAMVTTAHWPELGSRLRSLRDHVAIGLHFNLTLGAPLGPMPRLAPDGRLPAIGAVTAAALLRRLDTAEIEREATRQLAAFEAGVGVLPDFIDGHQHVHALPQVRIGVLGAIGRRRWAHPPLVRDPAGRIGSVGRNGGGAKAAVLAGLSAGFGALARAEGLVVNDTFGGVTGFVPERAVADIANSMAAPGQMHIAMCHPGFPDAELAAIDPVTERRRTEYDALVAMAGLKARIWHPRRDRDGACIDWRQEMTRI
jgi:predicted glycoside hydrolase/deacetylase ChbG (UPF0249 family)